MAAHTVANYRFCEGMSKIVMKDAKILRSYAEGITSLDGAGSTNASIRRGAKIFAHREYQIETSF